MIADDWWGHDWLIFCVQALSYLFVTVDIQKKIRAQTRAFHPLANFPMASTMVAFHFPSLISNAAETCALLVWAVSCTSQALSITHRDTPLSGFFFVAETRCLPLLDDGFGCSGAQGNFVCKCPVPWASSKLSLDICLQTGNSGWQMEAASKMNSSNQIRWAGTAFCRCVSFPFMYECSLSGVIVAMS